MEDKPTCFVLYLADPMPAYIVNDWADGEARILFYIDRAYSWLEAELAEANDPRLSGVQWLHKNLKRPWLWYDGTCRWGPHVSNFSGLCADVCTRLTNSGEYTSLREAVLDAARAMSECLSEGLMEY